MGELLATFIFFFAVIDPIGTVPVFIAVTRHHTEQERRKIAVKAAVVAAAILLFFVVAGEPLLMAMQIPLEAFEIAGFILFLFALSMIFGEGKPKEELKLVRDAAETAVFPLAVPSLAGPGAMLAAVLQTENQRFGLVEQVRTTLVMFSVLAIAMVLMLAAGKVQNLIGESGASIVSRVMGMVLASLAVTSVLVGIRGHFGI